jgi:hypothetical protein
MAVNNWINTEDDASRAYRDENLLRRQRFGKCGKQGTKEV